ncbi:nucleotidyltransferase domain-containing protein [Candidatus Poriferisodalis sp.]|uniref:nucleotidyltransferase domain-containing protein n=1 Tax=Candidatus Poriferisodalis sp. TaxID=3101277 RepID=UPI003D14D223
MAASDPVAAQRAASAILDECGGTVLPFGSLLRGEASGTSDVDLVAIYDDLDYDERWKRRYALTSRVRVAAGALSTYTSPTFRSGPCAPPGCRAHSRPA